MNRTMLLALLIVLAFAGIADAAYLAQSAYTGVALTCNIGGLDGCNTVAQSPYSHLFGVPLGVYGAIFYSLVFVLGAAALALPGLGARRGLLALGIVGAVASVAFIFVQAVFIKALCIYCLGSAIIAFLICWITYLLYRRAALPPRVVEQWTL
ncbi:MAG TPA: vitamin K epoxide reductase family protein [Candidatus Paceibacterota bacterium]